MTLNHHPAAACRVGGAGLGVPRFLDRVLALGADCSVWAIYGVLDLTREGRGDSAAYPNLQY